MSTARVDIKVVLLGKEYGGKTSLVERFLHDRFAESIAYQNVSAYERVRLNKLKLKWFLHLPRLYIVWPEYLGMDNTKNCCIVLGHSRS